MDSTYISLFDGISQSNPMKYQNLFIHQISEVLLASEAVIKEHNQSCDEISYIISGEATIYNNDKPQHFKSGDIHIIGKNEKHKIVVDKNSNLRYVCIGLKIDSKKSSYKLLDNIFHNNNITKLKAVDETRTLITLLMNELYSKSLFHEDMIEMLILQILMLIYRTVILGIVPDTKIPEVPKTNTLYEVIRYIDANFLTMKNIDEIALDLSYSKFHISHIFKEKTGMTISEYILRKKIEIAIDMLKSNKNTILDIAEKLGYESTQSFSKMFKKQTGMSPAAFKKSANLYLP